jgi:hypothetical protein
MSITPTESTGHPTDRPRSGRTGIQASSQQHPILPPSAHFRTVLATTRAKSRRDFAPLICSRINPKSRRDSRRPRTRSSISPSTPGTVGFATRRGWGPRAVARACQMSCGGSPARPATTPTAIEPPPAPGAVAAPTDEEAGGLPLPTPVSPGSRTLGTAASRHWLLQIVSATDLYTSSLASCFCLPGWLITRRERVGEGGDEVS